MENNLLKPNFNQTHDEQSSTELGRKIVSLPN